MSVNADILICGHDPDLLVTRRSVVALSGARVWTARDLPEFIEVEPQQSVDLLILCHTLSAEQCVRALAQAQQRWPHSRSLVLIAMGRNDFPKFDAEVVEVSRGPRHLFNAIARILDAQDSVRTNA